MGSRAADWFTRSNFCHRSAHERPLVASRPWAGTRTLCVVYVCACVHQADVRRLGVNWEESRVGGWVGDSTAIQLLSLSASLWCRPPHLLTPPTPSLYTTYPFLQAHTVIPSTPASLPPVNIPLTNSCCIPLSLLVCPCNLLSADARQEALSLTHRQTHIHWHQNHKLLLHTYMTRSVHV